VCEQPQQGARDIWTQIYPIGHTGDRRRAIVPKWLLNAANQLNVAALPEGRPALWIGEPALSPAAGAGGRSSYPASLPYNQAKAREVVSG
jgi:hypothetical protein